MPSRQKLVLAGLVVASLAAGPALAAAPPSFSLSERMQCQAAIERVYAVHRSAGTPPRAVHDAVIRAKAEDAVLESAALERMWGTAITGPQLQAELDRMAAHSQAPDVLAELWAAVGGDARRAAECLARPLLADRLIQTAYGFDERIHGALGARVRRELAAIATAQDLKASSGVYREVEWHVGARDARRPDALALDRETFAARARELERELGGRRSGVVVGRVSALREDETRFYVVAVLAFDDRHIRLATAEWGKRPFRDWWSEARRGLAAHVEPLAFDLKLPPLPRRRCRSGRWTPTLQLLDPRYLHTAVWTGSEMIVFGGMSAVGEVYGDGSRYDPATDTWTLLPTAGAPSARFEHVSVWTGQEMIVWGGAPDRSGARYNPATDAWTAMSTANAPLGRWEASAVWTGTEMMIWGGDYGGSLLNDGGRYNPATDTWTDMAVAPLAPRAFHATVWTGTDMIVWGGGNDYIDALYGDGARYRPSTNQWTPVPSLDAPNARSSHTAVWTGTEMIVWGGLNYPTYDRSGGRYNPATDAWTPTSMVDAPSLRARHVAVWTGTEMIIQGGTSGAEAGGRYRPATDTWLPTSPVNSAGNGTGVTAVWAGKEMIVWGGFDEDWFHNDGGRYDPATDRWLRTGTMNVPRARGLHAAVWTGSEMMVWGGYVWGLNTNTGGLYTPATDSWKATTVAGAPIGRQNAEAVWTGSEAIFWGGWPETVPDVGTGGRYDPVADTWADVSLENAPNERYGHRAVWTGSEMIVFGGVGANPPTLAKRYRPATDTWTDATTLNAPGGRDHHAAVWTGTKMIIWGGSIDDGVTPTGGRYDPATDTWTPTNVAGSPPARMWPVDAWTGKEMVVWGGYDALYDVYFGDGARYDPVSDTWAVTTLAGAPSPRVAQGVWTGRDLVLWGGANDSSGGRYHPVTDSWRPTSLTSAPHVRWGGRWSTVWTGSQMIVWGGITVTQEGALYCAAQPFGLSP